MGKEIVSEEKEIGLLIGEVIEDIIFTPRNHQITIVTPKHILKFDTELDDSEDTYCDNCGEYFSSNPPIANTIVSDYFTWKEECDLGVITKERYHKLMAEKRAKEKMILQKQKEDNKKAKEKYKQQQMAREKKLYEKLHKKYGKIQKVFV